MAEAGVIPLVESIEERARRFKGVVQILPWRVERVKDLANSMFLRYSMYNESVGVLAVLVVVVVVVEGVVDIVFIDSSKTKIFCCDPRIFQMFWMSIQQSTKHSFVSIRYVRRYPRVHTGVLDLLR